MYLLLFLIWYNLITKIYTHTDIDTGFIRILSSLGAKDQMKIMNRIEHIRDAHRGKPIPPTAKPLHHIGGADLCEIRVAIADNLLVRIHYFVDIPSDIFVILNAYTKPDGIKDKNSYNKANQKALEKVIQGYIIEALEIKKTYIINPEYYELLN